MDLKAEAERASKMLEGKIVACVTRYRPEEVCIEFTMEAESMLTETLRGKALSYPSREPATTAG